MNTTLAIISQASALNVGTVLLMLAFLALVGWHVWRSGRQPTVPTCDQCVHWDRAAGQDAMARHQAFSGAAQVLSPAEMAYGYSLDEAGERQGVATDDPALARMRWEDFGACEMQGELRHCSDSCPLFRYRQA